MNVENIAHFVLFEDGIVHQLFDEHRVSFHIKSVTLNAFAGP
jgi:hypothetical protein